MLKKNFFREPLLLIAGSYLIVSALVFRFGTAFSDEGLLYQWANRILSGELPYTNFFLQMAPLTFYLHAALIKIFGMSMLAGRIFKQAQGLSAGFLVYLIIARALKNKRAGHIAMVMSFAWSGALHIRYHWYTMDSGICILAGVYFFTRFLQQNRLRFLAFSGLCLGGSILFRQNTGAAVILAAIVICGLDALRHKDMAILKRIPLFIGAALIPMILFLIYYLASGGEARQLYLQTCGLLLKEYGYKTPLQALSYPLKVFLLIHKQDPRYYIGILSLLVSSLIILDKSRASPLKIIAGLVIIGIFSLSPAIGVRFCVWTLNFILFATALALSFYFTFKQRSDNLSFMRFGLCLFAAANLYSGLIAGGGLGRFVEMMTGSFYIYGVFADLLENSQPIKRFWDKHIIGSPRVLINNGTAGYALLGLALLSQNAAFIPWLDFPLTRLNQTMRIEIAKGIIGERQYVRETESVVENVKKQLALNYGKKEIFVFPLNSMLYPLIGAKNPTPYDCLQSIPFIAEFIPDLLAQLERKRPKIIILQKTATPASGPLRDEKNWVRPEAVEAVVKFTQMRYKKSFETERYYEVWVLREYT